MKNISGKVVENIKIRIAYSVTFFFFLESRAVYELMWKKNILQLEKP